MNQAEQVALIVGVAIAMIASLRWVAADARSRGQGTVVLFFCFFTWPLGILVWLLLRPDLRADR